MILRVRFCENFRQLGLSILLLRVLFLIFSLVKRQIFDLLYTKDKKLPENFVFSLVVHSKDIL